MYSTIDIPISDVMALKNQLSKLKHENKLKQEKLDVLAMPEASISKWPGVDSSM